MSKPLKATEKEIKEFRTAAKLASQEVATWPEWKKTGLKLASHEDSSKETKRAKGTVEPT